MSAPIFVHIAYSNLRDVRIACPISAGRPLSGTGVTENVRVLDGLDVQTDKHTNKLNFILFIIYIWLKQNYIKQYKSLQTNTLFSGYRILKLTGFAKKGAIQDF